MTYIEPRHVAAAGVLEAGLIRGPGCETAATIELYLKEKTRGLDRTLAQARRTFREGRIDLAYACGPARRMKVYLQLGSPPDKRKTAVTTIEGCG
ncbi:hypothetical protein [Thermaurantiacus sp.]